MKVATAQWFMAINKPSGITGTVTLSQIEPLAANVVLGRGPVPGSGGTPEAIPAVANSVLGAGPSANLGFGQVIEAQITPSTITSASVATNGLNLSNIEQVSAGSLVANDTAGAADLAEVNPGNLTGPIAGGAGDELLGWNASGELRTYDAASVGGSGATLNPGTVAGRGSASGSGVYEELELNATLDITGTTLSRPAITGDISIPTGSNAATIQPNTIVSSMIVDGTIEGADIGTNEVGFSNIQLIGGDSVLGSLSSGPNQTVEEFSRPDLTPLSPTPVGGHLLGWDQAGNIGRYTVEEVGAGEEIYVGGVQVGNGDGVNFNDTVPPVLGASVGANVEWGVQSSASPDGVAAAIRFSSIEHDQLGNLGVGDPHTQYVLPDGTRPFDNTGLRVDDTGGDHALIVAPNENLTANRTLSVDVNDADRTLELTDDATIEGTNTGDEELAGYRLAMEVTGSSSAIGSGNKLSDLPLNYDIGAPDTGDMMLIEDVTTGELKKFFPFDDAAFGTDLLDIPEETLIGRLPGGGSGAAEQVGIGGGHFTFSGGDIYIANDIVDNTLLSDMAANTIKMRDHPLGAGNPQDLLIEDLTTEETSPDSTDWLLIHETANTLKKIRASNLYKATPTNGLPYDRIQQVAASRLLGNPTGSPDDVQEVKLGVSMAFSGSNIIRAALTGDVTTSADSNSTTIAAGVVGSSKLASNAVTTVKITDANVTRPKVAEELRHFVLHRTRNSGTTGRVENSTTHTDLINYTIAGGTMKANGSVHVRMLGWLHNDNAGTRSIQVRNYFAGTRFFDDALVVPNDSTIRPWLWEVWIENLGSESAQIAAGRFSLATAASGSGGFGIGDYEDTAAKTNYFGESSDMAINTASNAAIRLTMAMNVANAGFWFQLKSATVEAWEAA